jgi:two-component system sensor histidine kinase YcbA
MRRSRWLDLRLAPWQRRLLIGLLVVVSSQLYLSGWTDGFRVSASAILYPILLVTVAKDSRWPIDGLVTMVCVICVRTVVDLAGGSTLTHALLLAYPGGVFYLCYDLLLCLLVRDRQTASPLTLWPAFFLCDLLSNIVNLALFAQTGFQELLALASLAALALARALAAAAILWAIQGYRRLLLREEHERRYRRLFLMTANLKTELYFLKKDASDIEGVMSKAYRLYEQLSRDQGAEELTALALSIARDVHEIKKDNLRIIRGIETEVASAYDHECMALSDLLSILEVSTRQLLGKQSGAIRLECRYDTDLSIREHYRLLSILKNLVTNALEAIQSSTGRGLVRVTCSAQGEQFRLLVEDDGPGIPPRAKNALFQVGYSTKFHPETGDINRGVGLPAVHYIVEELGGSIQVRSEPGQGACFQVDLPLAAITGGNP